MGCLRCEVKECLNAICEGVGVSEVEDGDFEVDFDSQPVWVRCDERTRCVMLFRVLATGASNENALAEAINVFNSRTTVFRSFLEDGCIVLRADLSASPLSTLQVQAALEAFEGQADDLDRAISDAV
jgi:hypothetical protein